MHLINYFLRIILFVIIQKSEMIVDECFTPLNTNVVHFIQKINFIKCVITNNKNSPPYVYKSDLLEKPNFDL